MAHQASKMTELGGVAVVGGETLAWLEELGLGTCGWGGGDRSGWQDNGPHWGGVSFILCS